MLRCGVRCRHYLSRLCRCHLNCSFSNSPRSSVLYSTIAASVLCGESALLVSDERNNMMNAAVMHDSSIHKSMYVEHV